MLTVEQMGAVMDRVFTECHGLRAAGQKEYANSVNAFGNFERLSTRLGVSREKVLLVYLSKHLDGIDAYVNGHKSQRESVTGRINDAIVYLCLLRGMVEDSQNNTGVSHAPGNGSDPQVLHLLASAAKTSGDLEAVR